jgi:hypothetical protein
MSKQNSGPDPQRVEPQFDSLNCDIFEVTDDIGTVDRTVRPMPDAGVHAWDCRRSSRQRSVRARRASRRPSKFARGLDAPRLMHAARPRMPLRLCRPRNGRDEGARSFEDDPSGDDLVIRMPGR